MNQIRSFVIIKSPRVGRMDGTHFPRDRRDGDENREGRVPSRCVPFKKHLTQNLSKTFNPKLKLGPGTRGRGREVRNWSRDGDRNFEKGRVPSNPEIAFKRNYKFY